MNKYTLPLLLACATIDVSIAQVYETNFTKNAITLKLISPERQFVYQSGELLAGFNRRRHAFIYKLPADSLFMQWKNQGMEFDATGQEDFVEIIIKTKSNPVDMDNFDGEELQMECEIIINGIPYNETALFKGFYSSSDKIINTSFQVRLMLTEERYPGGLHNNTSASELEITVSDAKVIVKSDY